MGSYTQQRDFTVRDHVRLLGTEAHCLCELDGVRGNLDISHRQRDGHLALRQTDLSRPVARHRGLALADSVTQIGRPEDYEAGDEPDANPREE